MPRKQQRQGEDGAGTDGTQRHVGRGSEMSRAKAVNYLADFLAGGGIGTSDEGIEGDKKGFEEVMQVRK